jgi:iron complex outermembrane receptor protein
MTNRNWALRPSMYYFLAAMAGTAWAQDDSYNLGEVVVTAPRMIDPITVSADPKAPQQPAPVNDGASFLKNIPGFSMIRKGGTDGDPVLRGLAGSRLNILTDGVAFYGGCGMRMDPPTAYIFPETFDKVTVIKGPQTVLQGNGNLAGVVLFERDPDRHSAPGGYGTASLMAGSWGRIDAMAEGGYSAEKAYFRADASHAESNDYSDGDGREVHSSYLRQSLSAAAGWTPDRDTRLELNAVGSRAEAAYADRSMDGVKFDREGYGLKLEKRRLSPLLQKLSAQLDYNYIDHVMDNYSLRPASAMYMVNNPDRETKSAKLSAELALSGATLLTVGADWQGNEHTLRKASGMTQAAADAYTSKPRMLDMETEITGLFGELRHELDGGKRIVAGLRYDGWSADRYNSMTGAALASDSADLSSGFVRFEQDLAGLHGAAFIGLGHAERPMDYWEASTYSGLAPASKLNPEKNTELDAGLTWRNDELSGSVSVFYSKVDDYILTYSSTSGASPYLAANCASTTSGMTTTWNCSGNVDATRYGGEADLAWMFAPQWTLHGTLAYVHADNDTLDVPLAQTPPLEGKLGLDYKTGPWAMGGVLRMVSRQDRVQVGYGNIVGQDIGATAGFATLALNASYKPNRQLLISAGVDNVFDKTYAEHISRSGAAVVGYSTDTRVNEPGRFVWAKLNYTF